MKKSQVPYLLLLSQRDLPRPLRRALLACPPAIDGVSECALNYLRGNIPVTKSGEKHLAKYKRHLRLLSMRSVSRKRKSRYLQTGGSFLPFLIGPAISLLTSLFNGAR